MNDKELQRIKRNEYQRTYREKHKEQTKKYYNKNYAKEYYILNKERIITKSKEYDIKHKQEKHEYKKIWRKKNPQKGTKYRRKSLQEKHDFVFNYKVGKCCSNCKENRPECLDFHHMDRGNKISTISLLCGHRCNLHKIKLEIDKCILLCANCHRKHHFKNNKVTSYKQKYVLKIKLNSKCYLCPENTTCCLAFHHIDPTTKINTVSNISKCSKYSFQDLQNEIQKCVLLCFNCHRLVHHNKIDLQLIQV